MTIHLADSIPPDYVLDLIRPLSALNRAPSHLHTTTPKHQILPYEKLCLKTGMIVLFFFNPPKCQLRQAEHCKHLRAVYWIITRILPTNGLSVIDLMSVSTLC